MLLTPLLLLLAVLLPLPALAADSPYPLREAAECRVRGGLPNVAAKLKAGQTVRVAYLGGSITAAEGWRIKTLAWLKGEYPQAKLVEINAAIGGTGSDLGVYRLRQDVLQHKPDLMFVEFAVNDGGAQPGEIHRCMEGIVRQAWAADPSLDICYVYTLTGGMLKDLQGGRFPRAASAMESVADHYNIPSIHFGVDVARRVKEDTLVFKAPGKPSDEERKAIGDRLVFSNDDVHPLDAGHQLYAQTFAKHFQELAATGKAGARQIPKPLVADHYERASLLRLDRAKLGEGWTKLETATNQLARMFSNRMPALYRASEPGTLLSFRFKGTAAAIYDLLGPDCGQLTVVVDGGKPRTLARFDGYCTYHRLGSVRITDHLPDAIHTVEIRISPTPPDKAAILFKDNQPDMEKNPAKYQGTTWYAGGLMLMGELAE